MTNGDRIRSMSDGGLAEYITNEKLAVLALVADGFKIDGFVEIISKYSDEIADEVYNWLKEESKDVC